MNSIDFYKNLKSFSDFSEISNRENFKSVPEDWFIIITDIEDSTEAINEGRYKEVNTVGAATIALALKSTKNFELPYVFGGDGATLLIPPKLKEKLCEKLLGLKALSKKNFNLSLRVGIVPVVDIYKKNLNVELGKFEETKGVVVPLLKGAGVSEADNWIKNRADEYQLSEQDYTGIKVALDGLSCRWRPIASTRGKILSLIIKSRDNDYLKYKEIFDQVEAALEGGINAHNPVNLSWMKYRSIRECLRDERRYHENAFSFSALARFLEIVFAVTVFKLGLNPLFFDAKAYSYSMRKHTDFKKFDDTLRFTIDCSSEEIEKLKKFLESRYKSGEIFYGIFEADKALMTCFVEGLNPGEHFHFIDANDGGYAVAARQLKSQMSSD